MNRSPFANEITAETVAMECVADTRSGVGESPVWSARERCLYFVDILGHRIHRFDPAGGGLESYPAPEFVTAVAPRRDGGLIVALERSVAFFDAATGRFEVVCRMTGEPDGNRFNDGKVDRQGRFWAGTMSNTVWDAPIGTLYRFGPDVVPTVMVERVRCCNGMGWSPDNRSFYFTESFAHTINVFDFTADSGAISGRRIFARLDPASGAFPDGLTVDAEGGVWSAQPVYGRLVRYDRNGAINRIIDAPVSRCTSLIFGGDDLGTLYVTSARDSISPDELRDEPFAGGLFAFRPGVSGIAETPFAG